MNEPQTQGILALCGCTGAPFALGFFMAWKLRARYQLLGFPGMLLPKFVREWLL